MKFRLTLLFLGALALMSCRQNDYRRMRIDVPELDDPSATEQVIRAITSLPGVQAGSIEVDTDRRCVFLLYDSLVLSMKNIEMAVAEAGFTANDVPPQGGKNPAGAKRPE